MTDLRKIAEQAIELAGVATKNAVARYYTFEAKHKITDYVDATIAKGGSELHCVESLGTCQPDCDQDLVIAWTGNGPKSGVNADFIVHACNNIEALARDWLLCQEVVAASRVAVANDDEWSTFDYKTSDYIPEADGVLTERMRNALKKLDEARK